MSVSHMDVEKTALEQQPLAEPSATESAVATTTTMDTAIASNAATATPDAYPASTEAAIQHLQSQGIVGDAKGAVDNDKNTSDKNNENGNNNNDEDDNNKAPVDTAEDDNVSPFNERKDSTADDVDTSVSGVTASPSAALVVGKALGPNKKPQVLSFIHKLYSMLEEPTLDNLIWWHDNNSNFLISPNEEFSKNLSNYFKHANIASFIRQLNMYGFHKVNDSSSNSHTVNVDGDDEDDDNSNNNIQNENGDDINNADDNENKDDGEGDDDETAKQRSKSSGTNTIQIWEFKHSSGIFKKGNIEALNSIKRRSFKNPITDKEVHSLKLTYDLPPNMYIPSDPTKYLNQMIGMNPHMQQQQQQQQVQMGTPQDFTSQLHLQQSMQMHPQQQIRQQQPIPMQQQIPPQQQMQQQMHLQQQPQQPQPQQPQQQQPQQQPPPQQQQPQQQQIQPQHPQQPQIIQQTANMISPASHEFPEDVMNVMMPVQYTPEQDRGNLITTVRDLQNSNSYLQARLNELAMRTEEVMRFNDIFKEELSHVNHDFVTALDLLKEQVQYQNVSSNPKSQTQSQNRIQEDQQRETRLLSTIDDIRSKVIERNAFRDMNIKSVSYHNSFSDASGPFMQRQEPQQQAFHMYQPHMHMVQTPTGNPSMAMSQSTPSVHRSGSQPILGTQNGGQPLITTQQPQLQQVRHLSTPSPGAGTIPQQVITSMPAHRNHSATSITSNPYYNSVYPQVPNVYGYYPEYTPQQQQQQQQQQQPQQPLLSKTFNNNPRSNSSSITKFANTPYIQQNGPTSNPQANLQKVNSSGHSDESPFLHKDIRYSISLSSERSRNASIYDPLQQLPLNIPMQMMSATQPNMNGQSGPIQFYSQHNQPNMNNYSMMDPNAISRQYTSSQMYTPVSNDNKGDVRKGSIIEDKPRSNIIASSNISPKKRNSEIGPDSFNDRSNSLTGLRYGNILGSATGNVVGMGINNGSNLRTTNNYSSLKNRTAAVVASNVNGVRRISIGNGEVNRIKENEDGSGKMNSGLNPGQKRDVDGNGGLRGTEVKQEIDMDNKVEREIKKMKI